MHHNTILKQVRKIILSSFILLFSLTVIAQEKISLDEDWKFHFGNSSNPEKDFNYGSTMLFHKSNVFETTVINPKYTDSTWNKINVPHDWLVELPFVQSSTHEMDSHGYKPVGGLFPETSIGWYRKHFKVDASNSDKRFEIQFDGIYRNATIWINGFYVGTNFSGYLGKSYDVTDYMNFDSENVLVVRVDATQNEGWFYEGAGIYRHVWLKIFNNLHIPEDGIYVYTEVKNKEAIVNIATTLENKNNSSIECKTYSFITDRNGKVIAKSKEEKVTLSVNQKLVKQQNLTLKTPRLWNLEDPYLYRAVSVIKQNGKIIDKVKSTFGIRTLKFDANEGFFLNEKSIKIKGTNNHQDHAGIGSALPDYLQYYRIKLLKQMGSNAYRTSHHAPTPEILQA